MTIHTRITDLIGNTPLIRLNSVTAGVRATIAVKVEYLNPGGSSKDRIAERIIDAASSTPRNVPASSNPAASSWSRPAATPASAWP